MAVLHYLLLTVAKAERGRQRALRVAEPRLVPVPLHAHASTMLPLRRRRPVFVNAIAIVRLYTTHANTVAEYLLLHCTWLLLRGGAGRGGWPRGRSEERERGRDVRPAAAGEVGLLPSLELVRHDALRPVHGLCAPKDADGAHA